MEHDVKNCDQFQRITLRFPRDLAVRMRDVAGKRSLSSFITLAIRHELQSIARRELIEAGDAHRGTDSDPTKNSNTPARS
jgi:hypothetical protein